MKSKRLTAATALIALLSACSSGGSGSISTPGGGSGATPTPTPTSGTCSLRNRQDWAAAQLNEWYLFPDTLPTSPNPAAYSTVEDYIDALTATARAQGKDRYFTYLTSIAAEDAYYSSGSSAGFGFRLVLDTSNRLFVSETFENTPALSAGVDRGAQILAIGTDTAHLQDVSALYASGGVDALNTALGDSTAGQSRAFRVSDSSGTRVVTITKADYDLSPVSSRYGAKIINDGGRQVGYVNLRTFISTADDQLRSAFAQFRAAGVTEVVIDLRYNGGGLVSTAELFGDLLGRNRGPSDVFTYTTFRASKSSYNSTDYFSAQTQSIAPTKIAFIGSHGTASASELVINGMFPYLGTNAALVGTNTYGKPVGQIAIDRTECDDRLRVIAFAKENANHQGAYYSGLASVAPVTCQAADDLSHPLGDAGEASVRSALNFIEGKSCGTAITASADTSGRQNTRVTLPDEMRLLTPSRPSTAQIEVPGLY